MDDDSADRMCDRVDAVYRANSRRVLATLIRLLGDFDLAEEACIIPSPFCRAISG
jgi:RNA polymerase sigma-70 factor (ECF subfamily)